jgi:hypothetical protein
MKVFSAAAIAANITLKLFVLDRSIVEKLTTYL